MLFRALGFLLLLNGGDDSPGGTAGTNDVLVGNGQQVTLIDGKFASNLTSKSAAIQEGKKGEGGRLGDFIIYRGIA